MADAPQRRLPSRKRPRALGEGAQPEDTAAPVAAPAPEAPVPPPTGVTLDTIQELVQNGTMAPHFTKLYDLLHQPAWRPRAPLEVEVEVGGSLATVAPPAAAAAAALPTAAPEGVALPPPPPPLLFRAFHRRQQERLREQTPRSSSSSATPSVAAGHCLGPDALPLDDWAPAHVLHGVKALGLCGIAFSGPEFVVQRAASLVAATPSPQGPPRRVHITRRTQAVLRRGVEPAGHDARVNWKSRVLLPLAYPGQLTETVQIAWELNEPGPPPPSAEGDDDSVTGDDLLGGAWGHGLLPPCAAAHAGPDGSVTASRQLRVEWTAVVDGRWRLILRLTCNVAEHAEALERRLRSLSRPRGSTDVPRWLSQGAGALLCARPLDRGGQLVRPFGEWRLEVEMPSPCDPPTLARGLFLHHLVRAVVLGGMPRHGFVSHCLATVGRGPGAGAAAETFARDWLASVAVRAGLAVHPVSRYPQQPRPFDLTPRDLPRLRTCLATPKVNGCEGFLVAHAYGTAIVHRAGQVRCFAWRCGVWPLVLEGEVLELGTAEGVAFVAYDCLLTPACSYAAGQRHATRLAALQAVLLLLAGRAGGGDNGLCLLRKPAFPLAVDPAGAIRRCQAWAARTGIPCDGVILADGAAPSYVTPDRLWKVKGVATVDCALCAVAGHQSLFELMLRAGDGVLQSLHRFRPRSDGGGAEPYRLPVLIQGGGLRAGQVVELGVSVGADREVSFPTLQVREPGKAPNFTWGAMDIVHAGCTLETLLAPGNPTLNRVVIEGPLRAWKNAVLAAAVQRARPAALLELGGGRGGDAHHWVRAGGLQRLDVVDVDAGGLAEYARRLVVSHGATAAATTGETPPWMRRLWLPATGCEVRLLHGDARGFAEGGPYDLAVLSFSVSQMVGSHDDAAAMYHHLFETLDVREVVLVVHDHVFAGGLDTQAGSGVLLRLVEAPCALTADDAPTPPLWCRCHGRAAALETSVLGSTLAVGIREWACSAEALAAAAPPGAAVRVERPYRCGPDAAHWLLRSLAVVTVVRPVTA